MGERENCECVAETGVVLYYAGSRIMHRQLSRINKAKSNGDKFHFWNLATYTNKRMFDNGMKTF